MFAWKNLARRRVRTVLTVLGVSVGVAAVVAMLAVSRGFRAQFDTAFTADRAHLVLTLRDAADPFISYLPEALADEVTDHPLVADAHPFLWSMRQLGGKDFLIVFGLTPESPFMSEQTLVEGDDVFSATLTDEDAHPMVIGVKAADVLKLEVGEFLELGNEDFELVGKFEGAIPLYEGGAMMPLPIAQELCGQVGNASLLLVELVDGSPEGIVAAAAQLEEDFPRVTASEPAALTQSFDEFELAKDAVRVFSILAILVGSMGVMNTMLMSVFERTREIGVLQAIGWSKVMVLKEILIEGVLVCLAGGVVGVGIGVAGVEAVGRFTSLTWVAGDYGAVVILTAIGVAALMGAVGSLYPAYRALRITPIEALRYE